VLDDTGLVTESLNSAVKSHTELTTGKIDQ